MNQTIEKILTDIQLQVPDSNSVHQLNVAELKTAENIDAALQILKQSWENLNQQAVAQKKKILLLEGIMKIAMVVLLTYVLINSIGHLTESAISLPNNVIFFCIIVFFLSFFPLRKMYQMKAKLDQKVSAHAKLFKRLQKHCEVDHCSGKKVTGSS